MQEVKGDSAPLSSALTTDHLFKQGVNLGSASQTHAKNVSDEKHFMNISSVS